MEEQRETIEDQAETVPQLAHRWQVPVSWVYNKTASGEIPSVKIGKYRRILKSQSDKYLEQRSSR